MDSDASLSESLDPPIVSIDDLSAKHRKERKELQAQAQKLKHGVPKGDKKKKKEVTEQIAQLEADLAARQNEELSAFKQKDESNYCENGEPNESVSVNEDLNLQEEPRTTQENSGRKSKAQKRREKKQGAEREREDRIKAQEIENRQGPRHLEMAKIKTMLKHRDLLLYEIPADGNCLYSAVSHQLSARDLQHSTQELRQQTSDYMREHRDDFLPFLTHPDTGDALTEEEFEQYCDKTASTPVWGGQVELRALSEILHLPIEVLQAEIDPMVVGDANQDKPLTLVYHRHIYRLGEHYNSVVPAIQPEAGEEVENSPT
ncbi:otu domain-containing protein 6b [Plakobranchus ocellatus]|uniref:ubiquitinyl hydrolase 1 n=1 Tax=Plakobranchus ocellatus TaxID=259542 RepID=A0AAV3ZIV0_9GAST|nr:otu domain-containing protein 6b [Plakobranchus ocellatus]